MAIFGPGEIPTEEPFKAHLTPLEVASSVQSALSALWLGASKEGRSSQAAADAARQAFTAVQQWWLKLLDRSAFAIVSAMQEAFEPPRSAQEQAKAGTMSIETIARWLPQQSFAQALFWAWLLQPEEQRNPEETARRVRHILDRQLMSAAEDIATFAPPTTGMDIPRVIEAMLADLTSVSSSGPNERLPKEEQIRCSIYTAIRPYYQFVCAERGYASIDDGSRIECDLWASSPGISPIWVEFKRCWSAKGWVNKPPEQLDNWEADIDKLRKLPIDTERHFILVGLFDCDPISEQQSASCGVSKNIRTFYRSHLIHSASKPFKWRTDDVLNCVGAWVWKWASGVPIERAE